MLKLLRWWVLLRLLVLLLRLRVGRQDLHMGLLVPSKRLPGLLQDWDCCWCLLPHCLC